jgi:hypothetical protein
MWQIQAGYPSRCLKVGVFVTQNPQGPRQIHSNEVRLGLVEFIWRVGCVKSIGGQRNKTIKPISCLYTFILFYIHPLSYFFLFPLQMSYNYIQNITDICSTFFGHTLFVILDSSLLGSALIHRVSASELHRATLYPTPICSPIAWHFYLKKHGAGIFRRMLCCGVRCFRHGMNCLHPVYFHWWNPIGTAQRNVLPLLSSGGTHTQISKHHCWHANLLTRSASATKSNMQFSWYIPSISPSMNVHSLNMLLGPLLFKFHTHKMKLPKEIRLGISWQLDFSRIWVNHLLCTQYYLHWLAASGHGFSVGIWQIWWDL